MRFRLPWLIILLGITLLTGVAQEPRQLLTLSDQVYYLPTAQGVRDLAVDLRVDPATVRPDYPDLAISIYYAGDGQQRVEVRGLPATATRELESLTSFSETVLDYLLPRPAASQFIDMQIAMQRTYTRLEGVAAEMFYEIIGKAQADDAAVKEYRALLDNTGVAYRVESLLTDGTHLKARIDNIKIDEHWHIAEVSLHAQNQDTWRVDHLDYATVNGFVLPVIATFTFRDHANRPVVTPALPSILKQGETVLRFTLINYRINQGAGAKALGIAVE